MPSSGVFGTKSAKNLAAMAAEMKASGFTTTAEAIAGQAQAVVNEQAPQEPQPRQGRIKLLKVGADVEMFLRDGKGNPVPVIGLIGGTKEEPMPVLGTKGFALQEDNVALEYNIPAAASVHEWVYSLMRIREEIDQRVRAHGLEAVPVASMRFEAKQLEHPQAKVFGCEPDYNVWEQCENEKPNTSPDSATLRTAGGHVHISFLVEDQRPTMQNLSDIEALVMALDIFLGVPFTFIDTDKERRKMYGKAGSFRPKIEEYGGLEYRVLSPKWTETPELMAYVYQSVKRAVEFVGDREFPRDKLSVYKPHVYAAINEGDKSMATALMESFNLRLPGEGAGWRDKARRKDPRLSKTSFGGF